MNTKAKHEININNHKLTIEWNDLLKQATESATLSYRGTTIIVSAVMSKHKKDLGYFPLSVEFEDRFYSIGKILGSRFTRREARPSDSAVLRSRIVDRTIRPLFPKGMKNEIQVIITTISIGDVNPDVLGIIGASVVLNTSKIPWNGPVTGIKYAITGDEVNIMPTIEEEENAKGTIVLCGNEDGINMIEAGGDLAERDIVVAFESMEKDIADIQNIQKKIREEIGEEKIKYEKETASNEVIELYKQNIEEKIRDYIFKRDDLSEVWSELLKENNIDSDNGFLNEKVDEIVHDEAIKSDNRQDGRSPNEIRPLYAKTKAFENLHGSGVFYRGDTHVLTALTLASFDKSLLIDDVDNVNTKKLFFHHYNFRPFAPGETGKVIGTKRREIGHGKLVEKALQPILPDENDFPYVIRLVSECFSSHGSTSMASVCGGTLALMDGGVPIKDPVAGISMGLMMNDNGYKILTDVSGYEDHHGDMDLKIAGTREGVTAIQMDIKINIIPVNILIEALNKAKVARNEILDVLANELEELEKNWHLMYQR